METGKYEYFDMLQINAMNLHIDKYLFTYWYRILYNVLQNQFQHSLIRNSELQIPQNVQVFTPAHSDKNYAECS